MLARLAHDSIQNWLRELQEILVTEIPLTKSLHLQVESYDGQQIRLKAPLAENINHSGTAFAGSLNSLVTLAGWSMMWLILQELEVQGETVIQDSRCQYLLPVTKDFFATCQKPTPTALKHFEKTLRTRGRARLELDAQIAEGNLPAVSFTGRYVVKLE